MSHKSSLLRDIRPELDGGRNWNATGSYRYNYLNRKKDPENATYSGGSYPKSYSSPSFHLTSPSHDQQQSNLTPLDQKMAWTDTWRQHPTAYSQNLSHVVRDTPELADPRTDTHSTHPAVSPQDLGPVDRETLALADPRSSLRKLLDFLVEMRDLDLEKCLNDYKKMMESIDPNTLTREEEYVRSKQSPYRMETDNKEADRLKQEVEELRQKLAELGNQNKGSNATDVIQKELEKLRNGFEEKKYKLAEEFKKALEMKQSEDLEKETQVKEQIEKLTKDLKAKDELVSRSERRIEQLRKSLKEAHEEVDKQEKEKTDALTRLSKEMGSKLSEKNPNITDLSDSNRPTKISEKYSELYDNEWTDALETLTGDTSIYTEESAIQVLLACLQDAYSFCQNAAKVQMENLKKALVTPSTHSRSYETNSDSINPQAEKMLEEIRKSQTVSGNALMKEFEYADGFRPVLKKVPQYTIKCLELCWLMNMHDPPVAIGNPPTKHSVFDGTFYKEYTRSGTVVEFVVWLPLLLHENGPLLQKGVVQPMPNMNKSVHQKSVHKKLALPSEHGKQKDNDPLLDQMFETKHHTAASRTTQDIPTASGTGQDRGTYENLYGENIPSTSSRYKSNPTTTTTSYYNNPATATTARYTSKQNPTTASSTKRYENTERHSRPQTSPNYRSAGGVGRSTLTEYDNPRVYYYNGSQWVLFNGELYTFEQWDKIQRKFIKDSGSTDA